LHPNPPEKPEQVHPPHLTDTEKEWNSYSEFTP
jgi:hypothetical protein